MQLNKLSYQKVKKKYLQFLKSQEVLSEPFRDKIGQLNNFYIPISKMIYDNYLGNKRTKIIGLTGGQGSGKSTISNILKIILKEYFNLDTIIFSIDDFYKTNKERRTMSAKVSPLFLTRGVPGTHDTKLLFSCVNLARHLDVDAETALHKANKKFSSRFEYVETLLSEEKGIKPKDATLKELENLWNIAKAKEVNKKNKVEVSSTN